MPIKERLIKAYEMMRSAHRILLVAHLRPDGDALSSLAALRLIALSLGKEVFVFAKDKNKELFDYLPGFTEIEGDYDNLQKAGAWRERFDLIIVADCGSLARTALADEIKDFQKQGGKVMEFDHHPPVDDYADLEIRYPDLSSTSELIYNFIVANKITFTRELADCVLTGILTDTGNFLYPSAGDATMRASSAALEAGAHYAKIVNYTLHNKDMVMIRLWGLALERLHLNTRYQIASSVLTRADINKITGVKNMDSAAESDLFSGLAGFLSNVAGVKAIMLLYEDQQGMIKGSLRSTPGGFLVDKLARALGGGGHERAAGFALAGKLEKRAKSWVVIN
jgi:phosphoesterase RecJ-like protein